MVLRVLTVQPYTGVSAIPRLLGLSLGSIPCHSGQIRGFDPVALELGEVVVAREPGDVAPQLYGVVIRRQLADHRPEYRRPVAAVEDHCWDPEASRPCDQSVVLLEDGIPCARIREG